MYAIILKKKLESKIILIKYVDVKYKTKIAIYKKIPENVNINT